VTTTGIPSTCVSAKKVLPELEDLVAEERADDIL